MENNIITVEPVLNTMNMSGMMCHIIRDSNDVKIAVTHNAGFPDHASVFFERHEVDMLELDAILKFLQHGDANA